MLSRIVSLGIVFALAIALPLNIENGREASQRNYAHGVLMGVFLVLMHDALLHGWDRVSRSKGQLKAVCLRGWSWP